SDRRSAVERRSSGGLASYPYACRGHPRYPGIAAPGLIDSRKQAHCKHRIDQAPGGNCMKAVLFVPAVLTILAIVEYAAAQSVTLYTAGPDGLAKNIAKSFTDKTGIKVEVYQATSGDVLARLEAEKAKPRADVAVLASWG